MKELTIKDLVGYLPYGLLFQYLGENTFYEMDGLADNHIQVECPEVNGKLYFTFCGLEVKPILHPLSDLTKEIEQDGKKFVPIQEILKLTNRVILEFTEEVTEDANYSFIKDVKSKLIPIKYWEKLFEWKFDVHNLIEQGLAIDVNTLEVNPYK